MNGITFTLLVAVYNAEKYLAKCLDSLLCQSLHNIQIVCVDDGSCDNSPSILQSYAAKDSRIQVIFLSHNQGQAHARNVALQEARGRYIAFVDSDDCLSSDALQKAAEVFNTHPATGCVLFSLKYVFPDGRQTPYPMTPFNVKSGKEAFIDSLTWKIHGVYAVRADIHKAHPYDEYCRAYSDDNTTRLHYLASSEVRCCSGVYFYRQHAQSVTHAVSARRFDYLRANESMKQQLLNLHVAESIISLYENARWLNVIDLYFFYYLHRKELSKEECAQGLTTIKHAWQSIELKRLEFRFFIKPGYIPFTGIWPLFRLQEELYFRLRGVIKKKNNRNNL